MLRISYDVSFLCMYLQISSLLEHMNNLGILDGVTKKKGQSVDGLPLQVHLDKVQELKDILLK